jgi:hypothetical protein
MINFASKMTVVFTLAATGSESQKVPPVAGWIAGLGGIERGVIGASRPMTAGAFWLFTT